MSDLKPCPFCGTETSIEYFDSKMQPTWSVFCDGCHASTAALPTINAAKEAWNTRTDIPNPAAIADVVGALKLALEYWGHRQQRYKNRHPVWVQDARAALAKLDTPS